MMCRKIRVRLQTHSLRKQRGRMEPREVKTRAEDNAFFSMQITFPFLIG